MKKTENMKTIDKHESFFDEDESTVGASAVPLNGFFGDDLMTLVYLNPKPGDYHLSRLRSVLLRVIDESNPTLNRADGALYLARTVLARSSTYATLTDHDVNTGHRWLELAVELGSAKAALELSRLNLASNGLEICTPPDPYAMPVLKMLNGQTSRFANNPGHVACKAWYDGARLALSHVATNFQDCDAETLQDMMLCTLCFMMYTPNSQNFSRSMAARTVQPMQCLDWLTPLWSAMAETASRQTDQSDVSLRKHFERFHAARLAMQHNAEQGTKTAFLKPTLETLAQEKQAYSGEEVVVILSEIPPSSDRDEKAQLQRYEKLRQPMGLTPMPDAATLLNVRKTLAQEFPWATQAIQQVMAELIARSRLGVCSLGMSPLLLVGPPGSGKTRFAQRLGDLLHTPNTVINMAGMSDVKLLKGVTRGWSGNRPSRIVEFIAQTSRANPLFVLDEVDKAGNNFSNGGDPQEALLDLLEPGNARRYQDVYLMSECDLSHCLYVGTSNSVTRLPEPLLSRMRIILFPLPGKEHAMAIMNGVSRDLEKAWKLPASTLTLSPQHMKILAGLAPRQMRQALIDLLGADDDETIRTYTLQ